MEQSFVSLWAETCKYSSPENTEVGSQLRHKGVYGKTLMHTFFLFKCNAEELPNKIFKMIKVKTEVYQVKNIWA